MAAPLKNKAKRRWIWFAVFVAGGVFGVSLYPFYKRTVPGRLVRVFILQQGMVRQDADDLADAVRHNPKWALLQDWSLATLERCRAGQLATNGQTAYRSRGTVRIAPSEIPNWLSNEVLEGESPEVSVIPGESGKPEHIEIAWGFYNGLLVGSTNYSIGKEDSWDPWYVVEVSRAFMYMAITSNAVGIIARADLTLSLRRCGRRCR